ncbi:ATP-binding domain-containing protein, partial [Vibrio lentus]
LSCQDERIPQPDKDGVGEKHWEEERRLLYVGITRAEKYLRLCFYKEQLSFLREAVPDKIELAVKQRNEEPDLAGQSEKLQQLKSDFLNAS